MYRGPQAHSSTHPLRPAQVRVQPGPQVPLLQSRRRPHDGQGERACACAGVVAVASQGCLPSEGECTPSNLPCRRPVIWSESAQNHPPLHQSLYEMFVNAASRRTGKATNPHLVRDMVVTHLRWGARAPHRGRHAAPAAVALSVGPCCALELRSLHGGPASPSAGRRARAKTRWRLWPSTWATLSACSGTPTTAAR